MQERGNRELFIDVGPLGKVDDIDPAKGVVGAVPHERFDRRDCVAIGRLPQYGEESFSLAHGSNVGQNSAIYSPAASIRPARRQSLFGQRNDADRGIIATWRTAFPDSTRVLGSLSY